MLVNCFLLWLVHSRGCSCLSCTNRAVGYCLVGALQGVQLSQLGFAACQSKNCTNRVVGLLLGWCTARGCSCPNCTNRAVGLLIGWCT